MIKLHNISKIYSINQQDFYAIKQLSLSVSLTEHLVIIGKSGSGKSTLINLINGLSPVSIGTISFPSIPFKTATVFQEARLLPWLNIEQNSLFWNPQADPLPLLQEFELLPFKNLYPYEISGGMASKTALIRALLYYADFLLLDEPFASLDYFTRLYMQEKIMKISKGMIFVTHNIEEAIVLGDRIFILEKGIIKSEFINNIPRNKRSHKNICNQLRTNVLDALSVS
ncbi:MAG: ABC transporter ATP-binding protein [Brevinema sp.]